MECHEYYGLWFKGILSDSQTNPSGNALCGCAQTAHISLCWPDRFEWGGGAALGVKLVRLKLGCTILGSIYSLLTNQKPQSLEKIKVSVDTAFTSYEHVP